MKATIKLIAEAANVSRGTVDKVLNDRVGVSQEVRERVKEIAEKMGYQPNLAGKALAFQKNPLKIGVVIMSKEDPIFQAIIKGVKQASLELKGFGVTVEYCIMKNVSVQEQLDCIRELYDKNISALALSPLNDEIIWCELNKLSENNIKIVNFNTDIEGVKRLCFVGQDSKRAGRVAGDLIGKLLPKGGNVLVISGHESIKSLAQRLVGFKEIIGTEYPAVKIIDIIQNGQSSVISYNKVSEAFKSRDDIDAIFITGRGIGGVGRAIREFDRKHVKFVCYDTIPETLQLLKDGIVDFTITQEPYMQGYLPIKILFDYYFQNKQPESEFLYTKLEIRTKENMDI